VLCSAPTWPPATRTSVSRTIRTDTVSKEFLNAKTAKMYKRIGLESRGKLPNQVTDLCLDNARTAGEFEGLTNEFTSLESLSAINTGLTTLKGFPKLKQLLKLDVSDNRLSGSLQALKECTNLQYLNISNNKIKTLDALEPLKSLESLEHLELNHNEIVNVSDQELADRRQKIFEILPNLKWLDQVDKNGVELEEPDDDEDDHPIGNGLNHVSGDDDDDDDEEEDEDGDDEDGEEYSDEEEEEGEAGPGLADLYNNVIINDEDDDGDYDEEDGEGEEEMVEEEEEEAEPEHPVRGKKRKHEDPSEGAT